MKTKKKPTTKTPAKASAKAKAPVKSAKKPVKTAAPAPKKAAPTPAPVAATPSRDGKMSKKKLEEFRKLLLKKKDELIHEAVQSFGDLTQVQETLPDMTDQASAEMDRNFMLRIKDRERKLILKINEVLRRIDDGSYGVCELCGDMIGEERLRARPETTQCIECKTEMEDQERRAAM